MCGTVFPDFENVDFQIQRFQIHIGELTGAEEPRNTEEKMHSLQLRFHLCERLEVEPFHNGGSCALRLFPGFLDAQRETMLHDLHERPLSRFGHAFRFVSLRVIRWFEG